MPWEPKKGGTQHVLKAHIRQGTGIGWAAQAGVAGILLSAISKGLVNSCAPTGLVCDGWGRVTCRVQGCASITATEKRLKKLFFLMKGK